jgi:hypothetical protein
MRNFFEKRSFERFRLSGRLFVLFNLLQRCAEFGDNLIVILVQPRRAVELRPKDFRTLGSFRKRRRHRLSHRNLPVVWHR